MMNFNPNILIIFLNVIINYGGTMRLLSFAKKKTCFNSLFISLIFVSAGASIASSSDNISLTTTYTFIKENLGE